MATLGNFLNVTDIRGSVGGNVYSKGRSGNTLRARVKPRNPRTDDQVNVRALTTNGARAAQALSSADKATWVTFAASLTFHNPVSGAAYTPTWMQAFMQCYIYLFLADPAATTPTTAPTAPFDDPAMVISVSTPADNEVLITSDVSQPADTKVFVYAERLKSPNRTPSNRPGKLLEVAAVSGMAHTIAITPVDSGVYAVKYRIVDDTTGQFGPLHSLGQIVVTDP